MMKTTAGQVTGTSYSAGNTWIVIYEPLVKDPRAALRADRSWNYNAKSGHYQGHPAIRTWFQPDHPQKGDPHISAALKVAYEGKIYVAMVIAPNGRHEAEEFLSSLTFIEGTAPRPSDVR